MALILVSRMLTPKGFLPAHLLQLLHLDQTRLECVSYLGGGGWLGGSAGNCLEETLLHQVQACVSYTPCFGDLRESNCSCFLVNPNHFVMENKF